MFICIWNKQCSLKCWNKCPKKQEQATPFSFITYMQGSLNNQFIWCWKFQLCILTLNWGHCNLTGWLLHVLDSSPVHIQHVLYYRWAMMMRLNVLLLNLLNLWKSKHFFAVTVSWKSQWDLQITITYEIIVPWWDSMLRNVGTIPQIVLQYC